MKAIRLLLVLTIPMLLPTVACQSAGKLVCKSALEMGSGEGGRITLTWDSNKERYLQGYKVYYGTAPGKYTKCVDIGKPPELSPGTTQYVLPGLNKGTMYHIAVLAYGNYGGYSLQSELSREVSAQAK